MNKYNSWRTWPNKTLDNIKVHDCDDTVEGVCYSGTSVNKCLEKCINFGSNMGYHVQLNNGKSICAPLRPDRDPGFNPYHLLRDQNIYKELNNTTSTVFVNNNTYPFPPKDAATVFFNDAVLLKHVKTGQYLQTPTKDNTLSFGDKDNAQQIYIYPGNYMSINFMAGKAVESGDKITFSIAGTTLLPVSNSNKISWSTSTKIDQSFNINNHKKPGSNIWFRTPFTLMFNNFYYCNVKNGIMILENKGGNQFILETRSLGYYCKKNICKPIAIFKTDQNNGNATYKGNIVTRVPGCYNMCAKKSKKNTDYIGAIFVVMISIILFILSIIMGRKR